MSGPKTSKYILTIEQHMILVERRETERRKAIAIEKIKKDQSKLLQISRMFEGEKQIATEVLSRTGNDNGVFALIEELDSLINPIDTLIANTNHDNVEAVENTSDTVSTCLKTAENLATKICELASANEVTLKSSLLDTIDKGLTESFVDIKIEFCSVNSLCDEVLSRLEQLKSISYLPQTYKDEIFNSINKLKIITEEEFLKNFIAVSVNPLIKKIGDYVAEYKDCQAEFDTLQTEYVALCNLYHYVAQEYGCSHSSIQSLKAEISHIKKLIAKDDEQAYISDCIDEVMEEMGYSVIGNREVTKRNGKKFKNELYSYDDGTAVNITYSPDGKIAMELGGLDTSDRVPTLQETERLCNSMEQFCHSFKEIEKRLRAKGVVLAERFSLLPPNAEYAQIINTSDYSTENKTEVTDAKTKRKTTSTQKTLRRE